MPWYARKEKQQHQCNSWERHQQDQQEARHGGRANQYATNNVWNSNVS
jgi:hypothetical protein